MHQVFRSVDDHVTIDSQMLGKFERHVLLSQALSFVAHRFP